MSLQRVVRPILDHYNFLDICRELLSYLCLLRSHAKRRGIFLSWNLRKIFQELARYSNFTFDVLPGP